jgi:type II secretory pathway pseudopilin PulG
MARPTAAGSAAAPRANARGAALLVVMVVVVLLSLATLVPLRNEQQAMQRERERELLFIGDQFRQALASYAAATPAGADPSPRQWSDLLEDKRYPQVRRHLRRVFADPMTGAADWNLIIERGFLVGVASRSTRAPLRRRDFSPVDGAFADAEQYADWRFVQRPALPAKVLAPQDSSVLPGAGDGVRRVSGPQDSGGDAPASPPGAGSGARGDCLKNYAEALNRCGLSLGTAAQCRLQAAAGLRSCLQA